MTRTISPSGRADTMARPEGSHPAGGDDARVRLRPATPADAEACGRIIHEAFRDVAERHGFPPDFPSVEAGVRLATLFIQHPAVFGVVAERGGVVVGSNFLDERDPIRGLGPITVDPRLQARGIGRRLMEAVLDRGRDAAGIRLLQDAFNLRSLALYASLGFEVREPVVLLTGMPAGVVDAGVEVRPLTADDLDACAALCARVHGADRSRELADALTTFAPTVAVRDGRVVAYASAPTFWPLNHAVAETEADLRALLVGAAALTPDPLAFLLPTRQGALFRWCLGAGLRAVKPMTLMTLGRYGEPRGAYVPSVLN